MWGYVVAGFAAGALAAWQWIVNQSVQPLPELPPAGERPGLKRPAPSTADFERTQIWAAQWVAQRSMPLDYKLRLIKRQLNPIAWPDYAIRVGVQLNVI